MPEEGLEPSPPKRHATLNTASRARDIKLVNILCQRRDSNPHPRRDTILSRARLPIPPLWHVYMLTEFSFFSKYFFQDAILFKMIPLFKNKKVKGFTLLEIIVSIGIFSLISVVGISSLLVVHDAYRKTQVSKQAMDTMGFVLESMTRQFRVGMEWQCANNTCEFTIDDDSTQVVRYALRDGAIHQRISNSEFIPLHSANTFTVTELTFKKFDSNGPHYPFVTIIASGHLPNDDDNILVMQTSVSARSIH